MPEADVLRLLRDADVVLTYLHGRSPAVIHRDLKPSNVIQRPDGSFAFVDFGAVRDHLRVEGGSTVVGTFGYMAPEQFQGRAGPASDVYAVGATAIAMLTGIEPEKLPHRGLAVDVDAALRGRASGRMREVLGRMLEPDPDKRATRIGPLLGGAWGPSSPRGAARRQPDAAWDFGDSRQSRRAARRAAKHARRQARRHGYGDGPFRLPFVLRLPIGLAFMVAHLGVAVALQVVVPLVLSILSIVFGEALRRAARQVVVAGRHAGESLEDARAQVASGWGPPEEGAGRGASGAGESEGRVRVDPPGARTDVEREEEEEEEDGARAQRRRSR
jgi:hypothetical protein